MKNDVPRCNFQGNHDELVENECCKRNGHDVQELVLEKKERHDHDRRAYGKVSEK